MLVSTYEGVVFATASRMVGNAEDARDITQTVFLKVWRNLNTFDPSHRFFSWIYRITVNESLNFLRSRRPVQEVDETLPSGNPGPERIAHDGEVREAVRKAMLDLSDDYRMVVILRHYCQRSYQEIAELVGIPEKTVKSRLYTARQLLAQALRRLGVTS